MITPIQISAALLAITLITLSLAANTNEFKSTPPSKSQDADDTARNKRDRDGNTQTPLDQGSSEGDISITKEIRQELMKMKDFSANAQNVKIITKNGHVTLRGPVDKAKEKSRIDEIAKKVAGMTHVDNQLEVVRNK